MIQLINFTPKTLTIKNVSRLSKQLLKSYLNLDVNYSKLMRFFKINKYKNAEKCIF